MRSRSDQNAIGPAEKVPDRLLQRHRRQATAEPWSLTREAIHLLEAALARGKGSDRGSTETEDQADAWRRVGVRWESDELVGEEIDSIYRGRTAGREISL